MKNTMLHKKPERSIAPRDRKDNLCQTFDKYRLSPDLVDLGWRNELVQICLLSFRSQGITSKNFLASRKAIINKVFLNIHRTYG